MVKTGVNHSEWNGIVQTAQKSADVIKEPQKVTFSKTTLNAFTSLESKQDKLKDMINQYKSVVAQETAKMKEAGDNIVKVDEKAAKSIQKNTGKVKFK